MVTWFNIHTHGHDLDPGHLSDKLLRSVGSAQLPKVPAEGGRVVRAQDVTSLLYMSRLSWAKDILSVTQPNLVEVPSSSLEKCVIQFLFTPHCGPA